jgi:Holliday junction resolvase RusA-like endonuclease
MITIAVHGTPAPKGSYRAMIVRGRAMVIPGGSSANQRALREWHAAIQAAVGRSIGEQDQPLYSGPIEVVCSFRLPRPKAHYLRGALRSGVAAYPQGKPDADKLARSVLDALTGLLYEDDAQVVVLTATKGWAVGAATGCVVGVRQLVQPIETIGLPGMAQGA